MPASNTLQLEMPDAATPALTRAVDTSSTTGAATAAAPSGVTYTQVGEARSLGCIQGTRMGGESS